MAKTSPLEDLKARIAKSAKEIPPPKKTKPDKEKPAPAVPLRKERDAAKVLAAVLAPFRIADRAEVVVFLDDVEARRVAVGWITFRVTFGIPDEPVPIERDSGGAGLPTPELWEWAWKGVREIRYKGFVERLADHCGVDRANAKGIFEVLKANRIIFPDNSISEWASRGIGHEVAIRYKGSRRLS